MAMQNHTLEQTMSLGAAFGITVDYVQSFFTGQTLSQYLGIYEVSQHLTHPPIILFSLLAYDFSKRGELPSPKDFFLRKRKKE